MLSLKHLKSVHLPIEINNADRIYQITQKILLCKTKDGLTIPFDNLHTGISIWLEEMNSMDTYWKRQPEDNIFSKNIFELPYIGFSDHLKNRWMI